MHHGRIVHAEIQLLKAEPAHHDGRVIMINGVFGPQLLKQVLAEGIRHQCLASVHGNTEALRVAHQDRAEITASRPRAFDRQPMPTYQSNQTPVCTLCDGPISVVVIDVLGARERFLKRELSLFHGPRRPDVPHRFRVRVEATIECFVVYLQRP